ncbi:MAG: N-acyl-D-amino-acid deacylase family protein [Sediminibacterium sp.]
MMKKIILILVTYLYFIQTQAQTADYIIRHGKLIDGTGNQWQNKDVAISKDKIVAIGNLEKWKAIHEIDAKGWIISPGFIDVHGHVEGGEIKNPMASNFIYDGVTTVVTGNCGGSMEDLHQYFNELDAIGMSINIASLIGHNTIRKQVMGTVHRDATEKELLEMEQLARKAMKDGAVGMSTGLIYIPGTYAPTSEIVRLAKVIADEGGVYSSHIRYEEDLVVDAINEAIDIGRAAKIPVEISHFKVSGQNNWGRSKETIPLIINARQEGIDVTIDQYPYTASSTQLSVLLPDWVLADGQDSIMKRLKNPSIRKKVAAHSIGIIKKRGLKHFSYAVVANYSADTNYNGKSIQEINILRGNKNNAQQEAETIIQMIEKGGAQMIYHGMSEEDVKAIMKYPFNMFASDAGIVRFGSGMPHPRAYGTNARVLGKYVKKLGVIGLEDAIRRMTSLPAQKFNLKNRGLIKEGYFADIVIFDENEINDASEYDAPHQYSKGIKFLWVNGALSIENGIQNNNRKGIAIRHQHY